MLFIDPFKWHASVSPVVIRLLMFKSEISWWRWITPAWACLSAGVEPCPARPDSVQCSLKSQDNIPRAALSTCSSAADSALSCICLMLSIQYEQSSLQGCQKTPLFYLGISISVGSSIFSIHLQVISRVHLNISRLLSPSCSPYSLNLSCPPFSSYLPFPISPSIFLANTTSYT